MDYRTGLLWQDTQHRILLDLFERVGQVDHSESACGAVIPLIGKILDFAEGHFRVEEEYMRAHGYPDQESHRQEHAEFLSRLCALAENRPIVDDAMLIEMCDQLNRWFIDHILRTDKELAAFIRKVPAG